ncbi:MAG TPA: hypothetical protein VER55_02210, partial [Ardenticatenaceae bacterium]|nr:hypothetical protein [Ardenticatenaceae bacterium]
MDSLWVLGAASLVLHVVAFILPFPLWRYVEDAPSKSWAGLVDHSLLAGIGQALAWLLLFVLYWRAVGLARSQPWRQA